MNAKTLLSGYDLDSLTVATLGGHSALDVCHGVKMSGFKTLVVAKQGRHRTYADHFRAQGEVGCIDSVMTVKDFPHVLKESVQEKLRAQNVLFIQSRYFWVYFPDHRAIEKRFNVPIFGSRHLLKLEERDQPYNQYDLLQSAGIRAPKIFAKHTQIDRPVLVKAAEAKRGYERGFFVVSSPHEYEAVGSALQEEGAIRRDWRKAPIEEFVVGAPVNFNFFHSPLTGRLELMGTDTRRQTNLDGFLRMTAEQQSSALKYIPLKMIETGHIAVTVKESLLEKAFDLGEKFVKATQKLGKRIDPSGKGIIGPFALQGAVITENDREDIVIFDVSLRIPGSPGIAATPYSGYLYGRPVSMGERIGMELKRAVEQGRMEEVIS